MIFKLELSQKQRLGLVNFYDQKLAANVSAGWCPYWLWFHYKPLDASCHKNTEAMTNAFIDFYYRTVISAFESSSASSLNDIPKSVWPLMGLTSECRIGFSYKRVDDHLLRDGVVYCGYMAFCPDIPFCKSFGAFMKSEKFKFVCQGAAVKSTKPGFVSRPQVDCFLAAGSQIPNVDVRAWVVSQRPAVEDFVYAPFMEPEEK